MLLHACGARPAHTRGEQWARLRARTRTSGTAAIAGCAPRVLDAGNGAAAASTEIGFTRNDAAWESCLAAVGAPHTRARGEICCAERWATVQQRCCANANTNAGGNECGDNKDDDDAHFQLKLIVMERGWCTRSVQKALGAESEPPPVGASLAEDNAILS